MYYIYKFENTVNGKIYIGSTNNIKRRYRQHLYEARTSALCRIHKAIKKYGIDNFKFDVICTVFNEKDLDEVEQWFITYFKSSNSKFGYNAIGVLKGQRELISSNMRKEWKNNRDKRIKAMIAGSQKESIVSISIHNGEYKIYQSVHEAGRNGFSYSCIYSCLNNEAKKGQGYCWFYYEEQNPELYIQKAKELIGEFKTEYYKPIKAIHKETGEVLNFKDTFALKDKGFEAKAVRRVLRGEREGYKGYYWKYAI